MGRSLHRQIAISLALAAMVLRAALPDGWMVNSTGGPSPLVICSLDKQPAKAPQTGDRTHSVCTFAAQAQMAPSASPALVRGSQVQGLRLDRTFGPSRLFAQERVDPNRARAPPSTS